MNSEVWVCLSDKERCLPFVLVENGYDVWVNLHPDQVAVNPTELTEIFSWEIIAETNTPRNAFTTLPPRRSSGIFQWINSQCTIFPIPSITFSIQQKARV